MNTKLKTLLEIHQISQKAHAQNKKVGLVSGCFDVLHMGHIDLMREAKSQVDILIVQVENDDNTRLLKGDNRPIHNFEQRAGVLSELISVDYIYKVDRVFQSQEEDAREYYQNLVLQVNPDYIFTNPSSDKYFLDKKNNAQKSKAELIQVQQKNTTSTTGILSKIVNLD